ncbi:ABC transporter ATP-binding protein [Aphanothece hegewaldii CCALA 016]|uniref:ABC transporter ATP-binding protein n=1 Tax=Aphanothece hegewaldii CCALA 016 TaxID=2107694 RepID=A0A2T1M2F0_9CHRO|nr:ABC transporter ATP-binding protein [Aphanothece hegewaldii]PSF38936.1 ABC transporter ATP-binding protein [Aphanothece hegewaldii CCALA 016]
MSQEEVISLEGISKCYKQYAHPIDRLKELILPTHSRATEFWALRNVDLSINQGETLGIIGRNGSGKSTLLQIIVGTLTPTSGQLQVKGRISALLELGSGFNIEFTGRQNVFFNGRLLGLEQDEIEKRFDEIAAFADIGHFIDQPVKTYSSGMFVRLAFAVAINVDPDILIVDEALAVGDEAFQRKCFSRIRGFREQGKTILFVSHAASSIIELCSRSILVDRGEIILSGSPKLIIAKYHKLLYCPNDQIDTFREEIKQLNRSEENSLANATLMGDSEAPSLQLLNNHQAKESKIVKKLEPFYDPHLKPESSVFYITRGAEISDPYLTTLEGDKVNHLVRGEEYIYHYTVNFSEDAYQVRFGMLIKTISGFFLGGAASHPINKMIEFIPANTTAKVEFKFTCLLLPGVYFLNNGVLGLIDGEECYLHRCVDILMFRVQSEEELIATQTVDFLIEPNVSLCLEQCKIIA